MLLTLNLNPVGRDESIFVAAAASSAEALLPVQMKDEDFDEYVNTFFPKRRQPKGFVTSYKHYYELAVYMAKLTSFFAAVRAHITTIALEATFYDEATLVRTAAAKFARLVVAANDQGAQTLMVKNYLEGIRGKHVIVPSKVGFDILFSGLPGTCMKAALKVDEFPTYTTSYQHEEMSRPGTFSTFEKQEFKMAHALAQAINKEFAGEPAAYGSSHKRKLNKLPLSYDMSAFLTRLNELASTFIPNIDLFGDVHPPKPDPVMVQGLQKYLNLLVVQEAEKSSVDYMGKSPTPPELTEQTSTLSKYGLAFNSNLGFSFYLSIPKVFASFITQTPPSAEIPLVPLNTWVSIWTSALMKVPRQKTKGGDRVNAYNAPRYVLSASQTSMLIERRKALGFFSEPGRNNEDGIFISDKGRFNWCPPSTELALDNAKNYEALLEEALRLSYDAGTPLNASQIGETAKVFGVGSPAYKEKINDIKTKISAYAGSMQTFSWDYNVILTSASTDPERLVSYSLAGSAVPNDLSIADYLRKPFAESMAILFNTSMAVSDGGNRSGKITEASFGKGGPALAMLKTTIFVGVHRLYRYLLAEKKVPVLQDLVLAAAKDLNLKTLDLEAAPYDVNIYRAIMDNTLGVKPEFNQILSADQIEAQTRALFTLLGAAIRDSSGAPGTNLAREALKDGGDVKDNEHYFNPEFFSLGEFKNVYSYLGGRIFQKLCEHILEVPRKEFLVINPSNMFTLPDFQALVKEVMPAIVILGKYTVNSSTIIEKANELEESNQRNQSITASDIVMPGSKSGFQVFPHQLKVHQYLQNHPRYAVLDVAPGGGKCLTGDHLVPTTSGLLKLSELWDQSDPNSLRNGFQSLDQVEVVSHERTVVQATKAFKSAGRTRKVVLSDGSSIQGLPEHKLWALESGSLDEEFIQLNDLRKGMWISKAIGDEVYATRTPTLALGNRSIKLSEDMAEVFGWLVAEGYTPADAETISFEQHHTANRERYIAKFESVFGPGSYHQIDSRRTSVGVARSFTDVIEFLRRELVLGTSSFKEVPRCIRAAPKRYQIAFLRSLWEGDGSIWHGSTGANQRRIWRIQYSTISAALATQVKLMMENMGIPVTMGIGDKYYSNNHDHPKRVHTLGVDWKDIPKFAECIGFLSEEKHSKLQSAAAKTNWSSYEAKQTTNMEVGGKWNKLPAHALTCELVGHLEDTLAQFEYDVPTNTRGSGGRTETWSVQKLLRDSGMGRNLAPAKYPHGATNRYSVIRLVRAIEALEPMIRSQLLKSPRVKCILETLNTLLSKYWVFVKSSKEDSPEDVYDLSVPGPHSYSVGGVYGHNTILLLADAAGIVGKGLIKGPPCIFAPNGLVRNWVEDLHKVTEGKWNVIPITTAVYRTWGDERLTKLIKEAPRNTIIVMSTSVLKLDKYPIVIGNHVESVSAVLEFARKFGFEYIALDESHRGKNVNSGVHKALRQVMVASTVKYVRLATGTLIKDRLTDVVGQAALFNAQIFRTAEEYEAENSEQLGTFQVMTWKPNTPELARAQLSKHAAVITAKRKEWAFMLPRPIETFIPVRMEKSDAEGGLVHQMMYDAILKETLEEIKQDKDVMALLQGHSEDDDDEDDDGAPQVLPTDNDLDDATLADLESKLEPYLARLEQLLTDPVGDPFGEVYFGGMAKDNFVSNKVQKCIERIRRNFDKYPWVKGKKYKLKDLADSNGERYVLMGVPGKVLTLDDYELEYESHIDPAKDPRWKPEPQGKVIVFCRYTRTVNAVYKALPPDLKKIAIKFHGEVKNKMEGFDRFKTSPFSLTKDPQILIANEQSISEGHNLQCFPAQTQVMIDYRKSMSIGEIYANPEITHVLSYNLETRKIEKRKIYGKLRHKVKPKDVYLNVRVEDNRTGEASPLLLTEEHPVFLKDGSEIEARDLKVGDQLITYGGKFSPFNSCPETLSKSLKKFYSSPEGRSSIEEKLTRYYEDLDAQEQMSATRTEVNARPEVKRKISKSLRKHWAKPGMRDLHSARLQAALSTPEARQRKSAATAWCHANIPGYTEAGVGAMLLAQGTLLNIPESNVIDLGIKGLAYTGDGDYWVTLTMGGRTVNKNPDFVSLNHLNSKGRTYKVVEVIGARAYRDKKYDRELIKAYAKVGIECLIVDADSCYHEATLADTRARLESFINNHYLTVTSITFGKSKKLIGDYKYDLNVKGNHNFFACAGSNDRHNTLIPVLVHNCASRIIRMESPWSPGELDQSSSRIFRPDPSKKFSRENVYLDWIICNGSLEVAKMGRLISKMLIKTQFDEAGNPLYAAIAEQQLPLIRMNLDTIASVPVISDIQEYIEAYANLVHIQAAEFEDMRQSGPSTMLDVPPTPMFKEARILEQVPYVPNLEVPDRHDFGLLRLNEYLQDTEDPAVQAILKDRKNLIGSYVHTEFGNGVISRVGLSRPPKVEGISDNELEAARRITRVDVQLANGDTYSGAATMIFLATNVTKDNVKDFGPTTKLATKRDKALAERARKALERQEAREAKKAAAAAAKTILGLGKKKRAPKPEPEEDEEEQNLNIELFPVVYNGFLALEGSPEDPEFDIKSYGFKQFGDYAYTIVKDQKSFEALLDYLDAKFSISTPIFRRLESLQDSFQSGKGRKFAVELAPVAEFKNFYLLRHKLSGKDAKGRPELKIYPVILNGSLMLTVDIATNPSIKRHLNKVIPGTRSLKFAEASGLNIKFFNARSELVSFVRSMRAEGVVVTNFAELKQELADLKTTQRI